MLLYFIIMTAIFIIHNNNNNNIPIQSKMTKLQLHFTFMAVSLLVLSSPTTAFVGPTTRPLIQKSFKVKPYPLSKVSFLHSPMPSHNHCPSISTSITLRSSFFDTILDIPTVTSTLFSTTSIVPLLPSFLINSVLFATLKSKLDRMLTTEGFFHALTLGTLLWHTLGWRGWTTCVLYLFLGQLVTKVKFREKEAKGIAEGRGGRRGPENVW